MRLIDADALKVNVPSTSADFFENCRNCRLLDEDQVKEIIDNAPTVDAAPVVRCGECERRVKSADLTDSVLCRWLHNLQMPKNGYCCYGERKSE